MQPPTGSRNGKQKDDLVAQTSADGPGKNSTSVADQVLIDTNVLVYRYDGRFPEKQQIALDVLRDGIRSGNARIPHQSIIEFVAATTRGKPEGQLLGVADACREAEEFMAQFPILYPNETILRMALRGTTAYGLSWFDAHLWAYAEVHGISTLLSEDFQHGRMYGTVMVQDPFLPNA